MLQSTDTRLLYSDVYGNGLTAGHDGVHAAEAELAFKRYYTEAASRCKYFADESDLRYAKRFLTFVRSKCMTSQNLHAQ